MFAVAFAWTLSALMQPPLAQISRRDATAAALAAAFLPAVRRANAITPEEEKIRAEATLFRKYRQVTKLGLDPDEMMPSTPEYIYI